MGLIADIGRGPVALDTPVFLYFIEKHPAYVEIVRPLFQAIDNSTVRATTSTLTLLEALVAPIREGNTELARRYEALLTHGRGLELVGIDVKLLKKAAELRASSGLRTPDAIQLASALVSGCTCFVTNDKRLKSLPALKVLHLGSYAES